MASKSLLPGYFHTLDSKESRERYLKKISYINGDDPYEILRKDYKDDVELWPSVTYIHVGMYLLFKESPYTQDQLMNYKSLQCYKNFTNGWVREVLCKEYQEKRTVIAKVNHSQRLSEKPLTPWVICEFSGKILAGHCDCMAGLGESCSHVASLLWAIEAGAKQRDSLTVTDKKAYWVLPTSVKNAPPAKIKDIQFFKSTTQSQQDSSQLVPSNDFNKFLHSLQRCPSKPGVLSLIAPYSDKYKPKSLQSDLPPLLTEVYDKSMVTANFAEILVRSEEQASKFCNLKDEQQKAVERESKEQANSRLWFRMRTGRITASKYKAVCHTDPSMPSVSLIMEICYPETSKFSTEATKWGSENETLARDSYVNITERNHCNFSVKPSGLFISKTDAYIGASPDGLVACNCCGKGICEIKCPFNCKNSSIENAVKCKSFCLDKTSDGQFQLKRTHPYYYQVQAQLFCTQRSYCDFVIWTEVDMFVERISRDDGFIESTVPKANEFFKHCILPEMIGKFYSRPPICPDVPNSSYNSDHYCYCREGDHGTMIACDNNSCVFKWFHMDCLKLKVLPKSKTWFCPECQKAKKSNKRLKINRQD